MPSVNYTVPQLVDMAVEERIPRAVRGMARRKLARNADKMQLAASLASEFPEIEMQFEAAYSADSRADLLGLSLAIDPENLASILDAIIKFLTDLAPLIKLFLTLFAGLMVAFILSLPSSAIAGEPAPDIAGVRAILAKHTQQIDDIQQRLDNLEASAAPTPAPVLPAPNPAPVKSITIKPAPAVSSTYVARWQNYDGRSLRDHGIAVHGFDPSWTTAQIAAAHDAWHDRNGGDPPSASRTRTRTVSRSYSTAKYSSWCPGGVCPTSNTYTRRGLFGIFRR
jgi:hypothetical protein